MSIEEIKTLLSYEEALSAILQNAATLPPKEELLEASYGQVAAEDIRSSTDMPRLAEASLDGYALRSADIATASRDNPVTLRIGETVRAGSLPVRTVEPGVAARVMMGSVVPEGADCVVRFEDTDEPADKNGPNRSQPSKVRIFTSAAPGSTIFPAGSSIRQGAVAVPKGTAIGPGQISVLTSLGVEKLTVFRRPVVAILASGDELTNERGPLPPGKIHNSNSPALAALVRRLGGIPDILGIARDEQTFLEEKLVHASQADVILTSGGVSKGDFDLVRLVLGKLGKVVLHRLPMGPGGSFTFGSIRRGANGQSQDVPVFALAGPPGCLVNFELLVRPALRKMLGYAQLRHPEVEAEAVELDHEQKANELCEVDGIVAFTRRIPGKVQRQSCPGIPVIHGPCQLAYRFAGRSGDPAGRQGAGYAAGLGTVEFAIWKDRRARRQRSSTPNWSPTA